MLGALGAAGVTTLAGCPGGGGNGDGDGDGDGGGGGTQTQAQQQTATPSEVDEIVEGGTLNVGLTSNPSSFDPPYSSGVPSTLVQNYFFESLVASDQQGNLYPWLAESYEVAEVQEIERTAYEDYMTTAPVTTNEDDVPVIDTPEQVVVQHPDDSLEPGSDVRVLLRDGASQAASDGVFGMRLRYNLHEGVTFTNGEEMTSEHVVRSYDRVENSQISAQYFNTLLAAEAVDEYTVDLYAQVPDAEAERALPYYVFSLEQVDLAGGDLDPRQGNEPIGTGAWNFESFEDGSSFTVSRRDDYWMDDVGVENKEWFDGPEGFPNGPVVDEVNHRFISEDAQRAAALQENEVDVAHGLTASAQTNFQESSDFQTKAIETGGYLFMQYPVEVEPFDQQDVRRAVNHLIPRQRMVDNIEQGWARPAWTPLPELAYGAGTTDPEALEENLRPMNEYDPQRAQELINNADVETPIEVQIETNSDNQNRVQKVQAIAQAMNATDLFEVNVETFEFGDFVGRILDPNYYQEGHIAVIGLSGTFNPGSFVDATHDFANFAQCCNFQRINFESINEGIENARFDSAVVGDQQERASRYDELWQEVVELSANSYLDIDLTVGVHNNDVNGFDAYPFPEGMYDYALYAPYSQQITYIDRDS
ncbi:ABC transporter substrate-binding protein [Salinirussus salinus]|jgi:ABC-type transport system substrate-binding protein|uniref:ABC transporter substrate-binding protein n=1 Tax=Salinirussus salinus TaxID=1198300 RepID=UPI001F3F36C5|nr:ABC transporter substrate-binding protein [Salinirussus salinus]